MVGGIAAGAAVRTFPFRVFSFPKEIVPPASSVVGIPMRINGEPRPMEQVFAHYELPVNPALWGYPMMLMTFCEIIIGIPRQLSGQGTQDDVETLSLRNGVDDIPRLPRVGKSYAPHVLHSLRKRRSLANRLGR
jgi:hypothetical protein